MAGNFVYVRLKVTGEVQAREEFKKRYLCDGGFDLNSVTPMPRALDMEFNNLVETGYNARYGEWEKVAQQWMLKEPAEQLGYSFPLQSRDEVMRCLESLSAADSYLGPAEQYKSNLDHYGHGARVTWREANWGTGSNAEGVRIAELPDVIVVQFVADGYPDKAVKHLSRSCPTLSFEVMHCDESKRRGRHFVLWDGREVRRYKLSAKDIGKRMDEGLGTSLVSG